MTAPTNDEIRHLTPRKPDLGAIDSTGVEVRYEDFTDTVSMLINSDLDIYALVDPETEEVVGLQMERFLQHLPDFIHEDPGMLALAAYGGISVRTLLPILEQASNDKRETKPAESNRCALGSSIVLSRLDEFFNQSGGSQTPAPA